MKAKKRKSKKPPSPGNARRKSEERASSTKKGKAKKAKKAKKPKKPPSPGKGRPPPKGGLPAFSEIPRLLPMSDLLDAQRRVQLQGRSFTAMLLGSDSMPYPLYPYTKGPDIANAGIGYGEVVKVSVYRKKEDGTYVRSEGFSRRTRSGRMVISRDEAAATPVRRVRESK